MIIKKGYKKDKSNFKSFSNIKIGQLLVTISLQEITILHMILSTK